MKTFLKYLMIFMVPFIICFICFEVYLRQINTDYTEKEKGLILNQKNIELIILGNSHSTYGIDPNQFDLYSYNLANVGQSLYFDKRLVMKHIDKLTNLKFVIINIDYHSLYFSSQSERDAWSYYGNGIEYKNGISVLSKISRIYGYTFSVSKNFLKKDRSKEYKIIKAIDVEKGVDLNKPIYKGWFSFKGTDNDQMAALKYKKRADSFNDLVLNSTEKEEILLDLEDFICQLQSKKITPILVTTPCYSPYIKMLNQKQLKANELDVVKLAKKFNLKYWNFLNLPLKETDFYNCDHLNSNGAKVFSTTLNSLVNSNFSIAKPKKEYSK
ncbi:hypothetical protein [Flavobacterium psychrotolerans]|uniref:SGNH/GDSL hydrolase family protein n=1 Tax=Flavobacterium psychrotolerans TaxID=2169410 RepID=A0A2U1JIM8_9FLAO|nr:hypothetical protein [Flavobacterium psychrotolerans]PWA04849.1 hypothetical protein DB895_08770 [Flavobacterium psychrotolerans]